MPQLNAYLTFDGSCADAMRFYERTLGEHLIILQGCTRGDS
jgi:PhnB protein